MEESNTDSSCSGGESSWLWTDREEETNNSSGSINLPPRISTTSGSSGGGDGSGGILTSRGDNNYVLSTYDRTTGKPTTHVTWKSDAGSDAMESEPAEPGAGGDEASDGSDYEHFTPQHTSGEFLYSSSSDASITTETMTTTNPSDIVKLLNQSFITIDDSDAALKLLSFLATHGNLQILEKIPNNQNHDGHPHKGLSSSAPSFNYMDLIPAESRDAAAAAIGNTSSANFFSSSLASSTCGTSTITKPVTALAENDDDSMQEDRDENHDNHGDEYCETCEKNGELSPSIPYMPMAGSSQQISVHTSERARTVFNSDHDRRGGEMQQTCPLIQTDRRSDMGVVAANQRHESVIKCTVSHHAAATNICGDKGGEPHNHNHHNHASNDRPEMNEKQMGIAANIFAAEEVGHSTKVYDRDRAPIM